MVFVDCTSLKHLRFQDMYHLGTHVDAQKALLAANPDVSDFLMQAFYNMEDRSLGQDPEGQIKTVVAFCNSGRQRSVAVAETLRKIFVWHKFTVEPVTHLCANWWCEAFCMRRARRTRDSLAVCDCCQHDQKD